MSLRKASQVGEARAALRRSTGFLFLLIITQWNSAYLDSLGTL